jgi:ATP-dependent DNA helicase RecQ
VGYAEPLTCRRRALLGYFGEDLPEDCGNCDICLNPPERYDATEDARKALSCVFRLDQRFGMGYVIDVLRGSENQRIQTLGHDRLSTYGIGAGRSKEAWGGLIRQLVHLGYLKQDVANYSVLKLTEAARPLLRGDVELILPKPRVKPKALKKPSRKKIGELDYDADLFQALRELRKGIADDEDVPPYIVFGDAALAEMAAYRPKDQAAFLRINGVGQRKMERYGEDFIAAIIDFG